MTSAPADSLDPKTSFQGLILTLQRFWAAQGCVILQPYDMEVGAGTFHPATTLRALGPKAWRAACVQAARRPKDGRYGENPNRLQHHDRFRAILKPAPPSASTSTSMTSALSRAIGRVRRSAPGVSGRSAGATGSRFRSGWTGARLSPGPVERKGRGDERGGAQSRAGRPLRRGTLKFIHARILRADAA